MIRHIVLVRFRADLPQPEIESLWAELHAIGNKVPGIVAIHAGRSESPEGIERGYMHGFTIDFTDWAASEAYQEHPDHKRLGAKLVAGTEGGLDGILVFDLAMAQTPKGT